MNIYIYIYKILFSPVNPESEIIPISTNKIFKNRILNLNNPGKELNVNKIHRANNFLLKKKQQSVIFKIIFFHIYNQTNKKTLFPPL